MRDILQSDVRGSAVRGLRFYQGQDRRVTKISISGLYFCFSVCDVTSILQ